MGTGLTSLETGGALPAATPEPAPPRAWVARLSDAIESEILPALLGASKLGSAALPHAETLAHPGALAQDQIVAFVELVIAEDMEAARGIADRVIVQAGGRDALLHQLLTPAARHLGWMWERDDADFMTVTLGVYRLDQIMRETAYGGACQPRAHGYDHRVLLLPAPGEQHSFGIGMVADVFREDGWCVRSGPAVSRGQLQQLVREEWFDVIGLSVSTERWLKGLPACIRAVRHASCNPHAYVMVGGYAVVNHAERTRFLGADATASDARDALAQANQYMETGVTGGLQAFKTRLVDAV